MAELKSVSCLACGAQLDIPLGARKVVCAYCNTNYLIEPQGSISKEMSEPGLPSAAEVALGRVQSEIVDLEGELEVIGMPGSIGKELIGTLRGFISRGFLAGLCFYLAMVYDWPSSIAAFLEPTGLLMFRVILGIIGVGLIPGALGIIKDGFGRIKDSHRQSRRREEIKDELESKIEQREVMRKAFYSSLAQSTTKEMVSEKFISMVKQNVADIQNRIKGIAHPENVLVIALSIMARTLLLVLISLACFRFAVSDELSQLFYGLPLNPFPTKYIRVFVQIIAIVVLFSALYVLESGVWRFDNRRYQADEHDRLNELLQPELGELDKFQADVLAHFEMGE